MREGRDMSVVLKLSPLLRRYVPDYDHDEGVVIEKGAGKKVSQLAEEVNVPKEKVSSVLVNHRPTRVGYVARDGDLVLLAMVIGGG
jgi:hypothetical protein